MNSEIFGGITLYNADCMDIMREMPDKAFDLAIVDPPYGIGASHSGCGSRKKIYNRALKWDDCAPNDLYFKELCRVSKNQIIWGMNYYSLPLCKHFIVWDKKQPDGVTFAQAELAYTSFDGSSRMFRLSSNGQDNRIHPTQKPVALYKWLLHNYAKKGDRILDTHLGSGSICIACHDMGFEMTGIELDKVYYEAAKKRLINHQAQGTLF